MHRSLRACALLLPLTVALAACGRPPADATPPAAGPPAPHAPAADAPAASDAAAVLGMYHWRLAEATDARGQRIEALFVRPELPLQLDFVKGRLGVSNSCNRMGAGYTLQDDRLTVDDMVATQMGCAGALGALDGEAGRRLQGTLKAGIAAGTSPTLTLSTASGDALVFAGEPTAATRFGSAPERMFLEVAAQTRPCSHPLIPDMQCLQVRELHYDDSGIEAGERGDWQHFYESIEGYTHAPGVRNVLRLDRYARTDVPADASRYAYVLDMVVESEQAPR